MINNKFISSSAVQIYDLSYNDLKINGSSLSILVNSKKFTIIYNSCISIPTSSAVVSDVQIKTSSDVGRDCELSCMYKDITVPNMSSVIHVTCKKNKRTQKD